LSRVRLCVGADVNAADRDGDTCLHMILRLIAHGDAGKHPLVDMFNCVDIPLVCLFAVRALAVAIAYSVDIE